MPAKKQLLFIEDEGYVIDRVNEILSAFPYFEVTRADNSAKARELLSSRSFDVVITDIYLRGASGLEFSYKALQTNKDVCVIIITGLDSADTAAKAVKEGAFDFVLKPPGLERLTNILKMVTLVRGLKLTEDGVNKP